MKKSSWRIVWIAVILLLLLITEALPFVYIVRVVLPRHSLSFTTRLDYAVFGGAGLVYGGLFFALRKLVQRKRKWLRVLLVYFICLA